MVRYNGEFCRFLSVLSNANAFAISIALLDQGPRTRRQLVEELDLDPRTVQRHLRRLMKCGYVLPQDDRPLKYGVNERILRPLLKLVRGHLIRHRLKVKG